MQNFIFLILLAFVGYIIWDRYFKIILKMRFYQNQGVKISKGFVPVFGSYISLLKMMKEIKPENSPLVAFTKYCFGSEPPALTGVILGN